MPSKIDLLIQPPQRITNEEIARDREVRETKKEQAQAMFEQLIAGKPSWDKYFFTGIYDSYYPPIDLGGRRVGDNTVQAWAQLSQKFSPGGKLRLAAIEIVEPFPGAQPPYVCNDSHSLSNRNARSLAHLTLSSNEFLLETIEDMNTFLAVTEEIIVVSQKGSQEA